MSSSSKIEKTIARQREKIEEGQFYEAHQQLRVIAARYIKSHTYDSAIDLLAGGAQLFLKAGQGGSGGDLCLYLMDVYKQAELEPDAASKGRLLGLLRSFPPEEPTKKRFISEMIGWSAKYGSYPTGDPELHHVAGQLFAQEGEAYEAERHLALGTRDSPPLFAKLEYDWYGQDEQHTAAQYAARAVFPYLLLGNVRAANQVFLLFTSSLSQNKPGLGMQEVSTGRSDVKVFPSLPLLNFLGLLLLAVERGSADLYRNLQSHYAPHLREVAEEWSEALEQTAEMYFGIRKPRNSNPLFDMMSSMFAGGGGGGGGQSRQPQSRVTAPPPAPALD